MHQASLCIRACQDGIHAANCTTQQNIQIVIHRIFELLVEALKTPKTEEHNVTAQSNTSHSYTFKCVYHTLFTSTGT